MYAVNSKIFFLADVLDFERYILPWQMCF